MTQDYVPCGKCGAPTRAYSHYVPPVTWLGKLVCDRCTQQLQHNRPDGGPPAESQQERMGK